MKKSLWLILLLSLVCGFVLSSCNNKNDEPKDDDSNQSTNGEQNTDKEEDKSEEEVVCQHAFGDWITQKQATCKETGVLSRTCAKCSEMEETTIAKTNSHIEVIDSELEATCENTGLTEGKHCSVCGKKLVEQIEIPLKAHTYDDKYDETCNNCDYVRDAECAHLETEILPGKSETCTSAGLTEGSKCKKCGEILVEQEVVPERGHTYTSVVTAPTCTERGYTTYTCTCNDSYVDDYVDASGHSFGDWITVKDATITEEGLQERSCGCGEKETHSIEKKKTSVGLEFTSNGDGTCYVSGIGACTDTNVVIPAVSSVGDKVISIGSFAFSRCENLANVEIPDSIITVGDWAFSNCTSLVSIEIPDSVNSIGFRAFSDCINLNSAVILDSTTSIGDLAFLDCPNLTNIEVSSNNQYYTSIDGNLYTKDGKTLIQYAIGKSDVYFNLPKGVINIGRAAFSGCNNLKSIEIPDTVTNIVNSAFSDCRSLEIINIPDTVTNIGDAAFAYCSSLVNVTFSDNIISIGNEVFWYCRSLTNFVVPDGVKWIGNGAFNNCTSLSSIVIPNGVTRIGKKAFYECRSLNSVQIGKNVTSIGDGTFALCTNLESIEVDRNNECYTSIDGNLYTKDEKTLIQYAKGKKAATFIIPDSVTDIGEEAFCNCRSLNSVQIGKNVTNIGDCAFCLCLNLASIEVDRNNEYYTSIDGNLYTKDGKKLIQYAIGKKDATFIIPDSVTDIGKEAFYNCSSLKSVVIGNGLVNIGYYAFYNCKNLTSIIIGEGVKSIDYAAFNACSSFVDIYYTGTEEEWATITIKSDNDPLTKATIHYNYVSEE